MNDKCAAISYIMGNTSFNPKTYEMSIRTYKPGAEYGEHFYRHDVELAYVLEGLCFIGINGSYLKLKSNECVIIFPGVKHDFYLNRKNGCKLVDIVFKPVEDGKAGDISFPGKGPSFFERYKDNTLSHFAFLDTFNLKCLLESMYHIYRQNDDLSASLLKLKYCELYMVLSYILDSDWIKPSKLLDRHVAAAQSYILNNLGSKITVGDIAINCGVSSRQLSRLFSKELGMGIHEYINSLKHVKAKELLEKTSLNITQIAYAIGFSSSDYFTTVFKKNENLTPGAYRKCLQNR